MEDKIEIWDRVQQKVILEPIVAKKGLEFFYHNRVGRFLENNLFSHRLMSRIIGWYQSSQFSRKAIEEFIKEYQIDMSPYVAADFESFNDFFVRKLQPQARPFCMPPDLPAPAEGRYFGFQKCPEFFTVKGKRLCLVGLLSNSPKIRAQLQAESFQEGPCLIARLCPLDYHRFHFFDDSIPSEVIRLKGKLHSVHPNALSTFTYCENERMVCSIETKHFGRVLVVPVGALAVGKIILTFEMLKKYGVSDEMGYFLFGGSTVILLGQKDAFQIDEDILEQTAQGRECFVKLGEKIGFLTP